MLPNKGLVVCLLLPLILASDTEDQDIENISVTLDKLFDSVRSSRWPRNGEHTDLSLIWQKYEFGSGAGNREEVVVANISSHRYADIPEKYDWQFLRSKNAYFIRAEGPTLIIYEINLDDSPDVERSANVTTEGRILLFKVFDLNAEETEREDRADDLMAVLFVESEHGYFLHWYRISENTTRFYSRLAVQCEFQDMEIVRGANQNELLLLKNNVTCPEQSLIDVYGFNCDHSNHRIDIWFCRRLFVSKTSDIEVCSIYGSTVLAFQANASVVLYASRNEDTHCKYEESAVLDSHELANFVCFESGYIEYLATAGREVHLFRFFENDFQDNAETDQFYNETTRVSWVTAVPLNTYRDESLLLVQFENSTVIALAWQGSNFKEVPLPNRLMNGFDLSKAVVVPEVGFMHGNTLVRLDVILTELAYPMHIETESMLKMRVLLEEVFRKQEVDFNETETRVNQSYLKNPVTGFWNLSRADITNVTIGKDVNYGAIKVGVMDLQIEDISTNVTASLKKLEELEARLARVLPNLEEMADVFTMKIELPSDVEIDGDFLVNGTLNATNVNAVFVNNAFTSAAAANRFVNFIHGRKSFPSIDTDNLTVVTLNGIPLEEYVFDTSIESYDHVDFSRSKRLEINGHLNFSKINDIDWEILMQNVIWKDKTSNIPGDTIMKGTIIVDVGAVKYLNDLRYPQDYVLTRGKYLPTVNVTGEKYFSNLSVQHFVNVSTINEIDIDDFIILSRHEVLDREITFENLQIDGVLQIDGNLTGINVTKLEDSLNETNTLNTHVIFEDLTVVGDIVLEGSIDAKRWRDFNDLLLATQNNTMITGHKKYLNGVTIKSTISVERINGRSTAEIVNLDTVQHFPYLKRISANVTFGNVKLDVVNKLEKYIMSEQNKYSGCMKKIIFFKKTPVIDEISFETIGHNITKEAFLAHLNETFRKVYFENLTLSTLNADEITPSTINGIWNYTDLLKHMLTTSTRQNLTGSLTVENLEIGVLDAELVNGMPMSDLNRSLTRAESLYDDVFDGDAMLQFLQVTGILTASSINKREPSDIYNEHNMKSVIFQKDVTIENLKVSDFVNGRNLSEFVDDVVWKTDRDVLFTGKKTFGNVTSEYLHARFINGHFGGDILDPDREQVLRGPVVVNGSITVLKNFNITGKIGSEMYLYNFTDRFKPLGNNSYALRGNFRFTENVSIARLDVSGPIQGSMFDNFLQKTVAKNESNITIFGNKLFRNKVIFDDKFIIVDKLDNIELRNFHEKAVYIDKPFSISSKIVFKEDIHVQKNLLVKERLQTSTIMGVDMKDLWENAILLDSSTYFGERMTLDNVTFQASVKVVQVNDLKMDEVIPLHTDQIIVDEILRGTNVTYKNIELHKQVNYHTLAKIYADTFTIRDEQNVMGTITIEGNVYAYSDFNAHLINGFYTKQIISTNTNETIVGNFKFEDPVILSKNLTILGLLNGIDPINWQKTAVMKTGEAKQTIFAKWRVHGNVTFEENVNGNDLLNGVNITEVSVISAKEHVELDPIVQKTNETFLNKMCENLNTLKCASANQIYKFDTFDYVKIREFEGDVHDIHHIDLDNLAYLLVNHGDCSVTLLQYMSTDFVEVDKMSDVGLIDRLTFYQLNRTIYILTIAKRSCGGSLNNIWKLEDNRLTNVLELGNATNLMRAHQDMFVAMIHDDDPATMMESNLQSRILKALTSYEEERLSSTLHNDSITLVNQTFIHELHSRSTTGMPLSDCLNCSTLLSFRVGIYKQEEYIYYNEEMSQNHISFWRNDASQTRILQIIKAHRPKSFLILNFDGFVETLLIFIENNEAIQIYEYRGIEGFVYRNSIKMKVNRLYTFKMRKYTHMEKRHYLAAVNGNRLTILEAKMHGEKLDLTTITSADSCLMDACPIR
ncbi:PREDICTED: uncharacterized protein LOC106745761 [Dinoponera quadriceps]|uniref:Uncharacterized protein LOC106745761 n=1 Tax=Dinoponera quadriceps TaxID=609295 RepID=A0A6P3XGC6_DINQU|nr:PREDICTED: uncharacterized protein LOC106745761 [Dinoponera quadriceps]